MKQKKNTVSFLKTKWLPLTLIAIVIIGMIVYPKISDSNESSKNENEGKSVSSDTPKEKKKKDKKLYVNYEIIHTEPISENVNTTGTLIPDEEVDLTFETSGKVTHIYFKEGSLVKKGQVLAKVNDLPLQAQLKKLTAQLPLAENRVFRQKSLLEKDAVSQESFEQVTTELEQLKAEVELVKSQIEQTELKAPFDGYIGLRSASEGSYVTTGIHIARLTKISPMKVNFSIPERYASLIRPGMDVKFSSDNSQTEKAEVYALEATIDQNTHTRDVRAQFPNANRKWMPGTYVSIEIPLKSIQNAISIPSQSLVPEMGIDKVYLYKNGQAQPATVKIGIRTDARIQVVEGLNIGDTLITSGTLQLRTGSKVELIK
jgi:membrane fusion protein (multidrug efflux system)